MFREARRNKQTLSEERNIEILNSCTSGVLNVIGDDGYPYGVPLSYSYQDGKLHFHCAKAGHKIDAIRKDNKVSFTVIENDHVVPEETSTYYRSVIVFGKANIVEDPDEKREVLNILSQKFSPNRMEELKGIIEKKLNAVLIITLDIEHISGKEAIEFVKNKG